MTISNTFLLLHLLSSLFFLSLIILITRYVLSYRGNIVSLSLSYTGSGMFSGIYVPYGGTSVKLVKLLATGFTNDEAIGKIVEITDF